jgi:hypothetical protein
MKGIGKSVFFKTVSLVFVLVSMSVH